MGVTRKISGSGVEGGQILSVSVDSLRKPVELVLALLVLLFPLGEGVGLYGALNLLSKAAEDVCEVFGA